MKADSAAEDRAARTYSGDRLSPELWLSRAFCGSERSTAKRRKSPAAKASAESIRTSHRLKQYGTSSAGKSTVARPLAATSTLFVAVVLPFTTSEAVRRAAGVPYPTITAWT